MDKLPKETARDGEPVSFRKNDEKMKNEIARLSALDIAGLRLAWRNIFAKTAPIHLPKHLFYESSHTACKPMHMAILIVRWRKCSIAASGSRLWQGKGSSS
jgi:hypothetical protein